MSSTQKPVSDADLSKLNKVIPASHRKTFAIQYLGIGGIEYDIINRNESGLHEEVLFKCFETWRNKTGPEATSQNLHQILTKCNIEQRWFPVTKIVYLQKGEKSERHETQSKFRTFPSIMFVFKGLCNYILTKWFKPWFKFPM